MAAYSKQELLEHVGHEIEVVVYGSSYYIPCVTIECVTCGEILVDSEDFEDGEDQ